MIIIIIIILILFILLSYIYIQRKKYPLFLSNNQISEFYTLMEKFDNVCQEKNIKYFIVAGSLLGAIRHGGIIPWDDDIDIGIVEDDFIKLQKIDLSPYGLQIRGLSKDNIGKVFFKDKYDSGEKMHSIFIDIFVVEKHKETQKYEYTQEYARTMWPKEYFYEDELYPLRKYKFGNIEVSGPNKYLPYCERVWSKQWQKPKFSSKKTLFYFPEFLKINKKFDKIHQNF
jgi:lipopolysaccharide cholinephosphotransferase